MLAASVVGLVAFLVEPPGWSGWLVVASMAAAGLFVAFQMARGLFGPDIAAMKAAMALGEAGKRATPFDRRGRASLSVACSGFPPELHAGPRSTIGSTKTGDAALDRAVCFSGPEDVILAALDPRTRTELRDLMERTEFRLRGGTIRGGLPARASTDVGMRTATRMEAQASRFAAAAADPVAGLLERARTEESPAVRNRAIQVLLALHLRDSAALAYADEIFASDDLDAVRVAARALGRDDILERLDEIIRQHRGQLSVTETQPEEGRLAMAVPEGALSKVNR
ncbi:MAG: hypothetical protein GY898_26500 [Proteobacteria bacterium]|nr:hypothetical protein [Pseudomonadota bacterium]